MGKFPIIELIISVVLIFSITACSESDKVEPKQQADAADTASVKAEVLSDKQIEDIVRASYRFVAMYNVNNKFAMKMGWDHCVADTTLKDHSMKDIARPNNDTLYISCMLDLRKDPAIIDYPAFSSKYVSLMVTAYDHHVTVPLSVTKGDFSTPGKALFYSKRTEGFDGKPVEGVDRMFEMDGDFVSAVFRVMPHASDPERLEKIRGEMKEVKVVTLSELRGNERKPASDLSFPDVGLTDVDIYKNNFPEVMQFVVDHTTLDADDEVDASLLSALKPMGIAPSSQPGDIKGFDPERFQAMAEKVRADVFKLVFDEDYMRENALKLFKTKGNITADLLLSQSILGPIGLPATEALYPPVITEDGQPMNALNDYVLHMSKDELPPAKAFWSVTLYDFKNGFFIPNPVKKYSVGENAGMKLNGDGGIDIYISAEKPDEVPSENWLPINRQDENLDIIMRIYIPDTEKFKTYQVPKLRKLSADK